MIEKFRFWRRLALISYVLLIVTITAWYFVISPPANLSFALVSGLYLLVLLLPLKQLIQNNNRVYMWSGYLILIYFAHAVVESWANDEHRILAVFELVLSVIYFIAVTYCYRYSRSRD